MLKIYTRTGDKGQTSLFGGKRVSKADLRIEVIGEIDELNSLIGVVIFQNQKSIRQLADKNQKHRLKIKNELVKVQQDLLDIGSLLAESSTRRYTLPARNASQSDAGGDARRCKNRIKNLEDSIDKITEELPELKNFVLPGGGEVGSLLHFARSVCRRAERRVVQLSKKEKVDESILVYFNRLSDLLFVMARFVNFKEKQKEIIWIKK